MTSTKLGVQDFLEMTDQFHPEWSVFAVEASIEQVEEALSKLQQSRQQDSDVSIHLQTIDGSLEEKLQGRRIAYVVPVVQPFNSSWVIVYRGVFYSDSMASDWASSLSSKLSTRAVALFSTDTSGVLGYALFDKGDRLEESYCCPQENEGISWFSKLRSEPELDFLDDIDEDEYDDDDEYNDALERVCIHNEAVWRQFINKVFASWGVYLPAFYPMNQPDGIRVEVEKSSEHSIERIDLLYLKQNW